MKILQSETSSKCSVHNIQQQLLVASGIRVHIYTHTHKTLNNSGTLTIGIQLAQEWEGGAAVVAGPAIALCETNTNHCHHLE